jgi:hypothetical protein
VVAPADAGGGAEDARREWRIQAAIAAQEALLWAERGRPK